MFEAPWGELTKKHIRKFYIEIVSVIFAKKVNVYGWDFYLNTSPDKMTYFELLRNMYKYDADINRSRNHFEGCLINFYYGYSLSKLKKFKIHSNMGKLDKHKNLIKRIEKVLFN